MGFPRAGSLGVAAVLFAAGPVVAAPTAAQALAECRALYEQDQLAPAIPRCEEAVALDFGLAEAHFLLGRAHYLLATPARNEGDDAQREAHRRKGMESYRRYLAIAESVGEDPANRPKALGELLGLYIMGDDVDEAILPYADELARLPALQFDHLVFMDAAYELHKRWADAERASRRAVEANPGHAETCLGLASLLGRPVWGGAARFDEMISVLERCVKLTPRDPVGYFRLARLLWEKSYRDPTVTDEAKAAYVMRGLAHADNALALDPDYFEAVIYKGLLLRSKAMGAADESEQRRLLDEANALSQRGLALKKGGAKLREDPYAAFFGPPPAPPPAPSSPVRPSIDLGGAGVAPPPLPPPPAPAAVRVGGQIKAPRKLVSADPVYPDIAKQARVQGVVILECTIDPQGRVSDVRVLRSIPLLDQAAIDAVRQWVFAPTLLNGVPVPVIMTLTVGFTLS
jgi:protein TonB